VWQIDLDPLVTIGICVRNSEDSIGEAIDSVMSQDYPHASIRLVVVDDGSDDGTLAAVQKSISKLDMETVLLPTSWKGLGSARNTVIVNSKGDYILWVDGDMVLSPIFLSKLVAFMEKNPKSGIVKGRQVLSIGSNLLASLELFSRAAGRMVDYQSQKGQFKVVGTGGALYRIKAVQQVGGFDPNLKGYNEDWDFEIRLRKLGWSLNIADVYFSDYERYGLTWKSLWRRYWIRGYHTYYFLLKNNGLIKHYRMFPPAAFLSGVLSAFKLFRLTGKKFVFLMPVPSAFKMTAWYVGFVRGKLDARARNN
jgi:glycosyltransferase involved in cell wall biosynthesis